MLPISGGLIDLDYRGLLEADEGALRELLEEAQLTAWNHFGKKIRFYAPSFMHYKTKHYCSSQEAFPSISVTGSSCSLRCKHCGGTVLNTMYPAASPEKLVKLCRRLKAKGAVGCLISGGCLPNGAVPLEKFADALGKIKRELGLNLVVHTGVISHDTAKKLKEAGIDAALIDVIGSDETIRRITELDVSVNHYEQSLQALQDAGVLTVPHVIVGLQFGKLKGELNALRIISNYEPAAVVVIAFMPIRGTEMEETAPPSPAAIGKVLVAARLIMPSTPLALGCMRPKGAHRAETDALAVNAGFNAIAFPAETSVKLAKSLNYDISFSSQCCSQIYEDVKSWR